jgi:hypothetical protein
VGTVTVPGTEALIAKECESEAIERRTLKYIITP